MDTTTAGLVVAIAALIVLAVLLWRSRQRTAAAEASHSLGQLFSTTVQLAASDTGSAQDAVTEAARLRGDDSPGPPITAEAVRAARVLWVDDHPDNNLLETVALESLGKFVTTATSTRAALAYLERLDYALVITDVRRGDDPQAGDELIRTLRDRGDTTPVVVYTMDAATRRTPLMQQGADAVVDLPGALVHEVTTLLDHNPGPR